MTPSEAVRPVPEDPSRPNRIVFEPVSIEPGMAVRIGTGLNEAETICIYASPEGSVCSVDLAGLRHPGIRVPLLGLWFDDYLRTFITAPLFKEVEFLTATDGILTVGVRDHGHKMPHIVAACVPESPRPDARVSLRLFRKPQSLPLIIERMTAQEVRDLLPKQPDEPLPIKSKLPPVKLLKLHRLPAVTVFLPEPGLDPMLIKKQLALATHTAGLLRSGESGDLPPVLAAGPRTVHLLVNEAQLLLFFAASDIHDLQLSYRFRTNRHGPGKATRNYRKGNATIRIGEQAISAKVLVYRLNKKDVLALRANDPEELSAFLVEFNRILENTVGSGIND